MTIDRRMFILGFTTVILVLIGTAVGAGALENEVVDPGTSVPAQQSVEQPASDEPESSDPQAGEPAPASTEAPPSSAPTAAPASGAAATGQSASGGSSVPETADEPGGILPAGEEPTAVGPPARPFQIVSPARPASSQSIPAIPTGEPFGVVLAAAILLLVGAAIGHAWAQATGRLDSIA